ncbi:hypothetical protein HRR83_000126 [Exophiala dermatitidis]|uniref:Uncharacterized protein n=1 Tax=Exophiala dermatitidis TaxID=5970 RepID=A0AAN6IZ22_EXODE|nr:hypothetical protein HRR73_002662 [Exophiala dermatitidis]KAJ4527374.1 hypothetical protein HRR74_000127 [Exophiala dermatitidis]KAJ4530935.1 hypothetical protein HRR76_008624 [Exophiala dermatitidis]KAJ4558106.1 hypothetical protein HRR77_000128 [Exophiala dermatitidis]KAJ4581864.1 hypothetical protein HRR79_000869 [Exophiala dermatitidis]
MYLPHSRRKPRKFPSSQPHRSISRNHTSLQVLDFLLFLLHVFCCASYLDTSVAKVPEIEYGDPTGHSPHPVRSIQPNPPPARLQASTSRSVSARFPHDSPGR